MTHERKPRRPLLDGDFWMIGDNPDLGELQGRRERAGGRPQQCVDHHVFQSADGAWHLWGCIRHTAVGRLLYHWEAANLTDSHWRQTGEIIRADHGAGECLDEHDGDEWLQSPFVVRHQGTFYMFYGGHGTGCDEDGNPVEKGSEARACQICLMTSPDGRNWARHRDENGHSRLFAGPGETRDPCVRRFNGGWHMYYAGYHGKHRANAGFYLRTSRDLRRWSPWRLVHQDPRYGAGPWNTECPHVVERAGFYYLFRTEDYGSASTHVFRSPHPADFGVADADVHYLGKITVAAPEIIVGSDGCEYISSNHNLSGGTVLCRLRWEED